YDVWVLYADMSPPEAGSEFIDAQSLILLDVGTDEFDGRELYFEEYYESGVISRYFFDEDVIIGAIALKVPYTFPKEFADNLINRVVFITIEEGVEDESKFDTPENAMSYAEYLQMVFGGGGSN
ncbi:MAG: hypothetical protein FWD35_06715, partial [Oscillospiraceae bacterium]|nr:hypothetical protein [Oscillospiraceae bacterium]